MAKSANQKLKLLYLMRILLDKTDENHPMTVAELIAALADYGVSAERKSIYDDLESLRLFGMDIIQVRSKTTGYYIGGREFELPELKLLVDSVQSSKFITQRKTLSLIKKIESLASRYDAQLLQRQVYVQNRVKTMNESVFYSVDEISGAISDDRRIRFKYFDYTISKERAFRKNGEYYEVSPFALIWDDENYYLLAYDAAAGIMKHYRVDKMEGIRETDEKRLGKDVFEQIDMSAYSKKVFGMFSGDEERVKLRFTDHLVGAVIDRFGKDTVIVPDEQGYFTTTVTVAVSPQFFAWIFGFGDEAEILSPPRVRDEMATLLGGVIAKYDKR